MKTLVLVRHAESRAAVDGVYGGRVGCQGLTLEGRRQAEQLSRYLESEIGNVPLLLSSPIRRARETAAFITNEAGARVSVDDDLREGDCGRADGLSRAEVRRRFGAHGGYAVEADRPVAPGAETWQNVIDRGASAFGRLMSSPDSLIVGVTHLGIIAAALVACGQISVDDPISGIEVPFASITTWRCDPGRSPTLEMLGDDSYLCG